MHSFTTVHNHFLIQLINQLYNALNYTLMVVQIHLFSVAPLISTVKDTLKDSELGVSFFIPIMQRILTVFSK